MTTITMSEARQRLAQYGMRLSRVNAGFRVAFHELAYQDAEVSAYYTDDLEDAVLSGCMMRARPALDVRFAKQTNGVRR